LPNETPLIQTSDNRPRRPEEEINLVVNAFYRSAATSMVKGSGNGLSLVDSILKLHPVDLKVSSKAGEGTTFTLTFPSADMLAIMHSEN
jgi:signal transduction histidine kinase